MGTWNSSDMNGVIERIRQLAVKSKYVKLYEDFGSEIVLRHIGKVTGEVDRQYLDFLLKTNGASILDYAFLGLKNRELGVNLYENIRELWQMDCMLTFKFWGFAGSSFGANFGYLDQQDSCGNHFIGYYSHHEPERVRVVASSFAIFIDKFVQEVEATLLEDANAIDFSGEEWFMDVDRLCVGDAELHSYLYRVGSVEYDLYGKR